MEGNEGLAADSGELAAVGTQAGPHRQVPQLGKPDDGLLQIRVDIPKANDAIIY